MKALSDKNMSINTDIPDNPPEIIMQAQASQKTLRSSVEEAMSNYFAHLDGQPASNLYQMVLAEVEAPLLEAVMTYTKDNQSQASEILGLNRGTLRKKLKTYGML